MSKTQSESIPASTCAALELPLLLEVVAKLAATDLGRRSVRSLVPLSDRGRFDRDRLRLAEVDRLLGQGSLIPSFEESIEDLFGRLLDPASSVVGLDLVRLAGVLELRDQAARRVEAAEPSCPTLSSWVATVPSMREIVRRVRSVFDQKGGVRDDASPALAKFGRQVRRQREGLYQQFQKLIGQYQEHLSEETIPLREGRLVMLLNSGARGRIPGLVHGRSGSGRSFYFEPFETVEGNNQLQHAVGEVERERQRLVRETLELVLEHHHEIESHLSFVAELDRLQASARFGNMSKGRLAEVSSGHDLRLAAARHPLLIPELADLRLAAFGQPGHTGEVVALDLTLDDDCRVLVITGPNAGGKTVALKTVGLLTLAHQCGLPVPVEVGTQLPFVSAVVATVGDEQDLLTDRSTFSGRLVRLETAWRLANRGSLILLDELGSGTDPEEGAALSIALLERLIEQGSLAVITTHLTQLAVVALEREGAGCAAMEFAGESGEPTFRLLPGPPGGSEALALARRLGLAPSWIERAQELLGREQVELRKVLREAEALRVKLRRTEVELGAERGRIEQDRRRLDEAQETLDAERRSLKRKYRAELETFRERVRSQLGDEFARLKTEMDDGRRKGLARDATRRLFADTPEALEGPVSEEREMPLELGGAVRHRGLGWVGRLDKLERGKAEVSVSGKRFRCKERDLVGVEAAVESSTKPASVAPFEMSGEPLELILIGKRVEEALEEVERCLDRALLEGRERLRLVHGHGSGRLRSAIREHLRRHRVVTSWRPGKREEGGDGATVVRLD